ncbi:MAG: hypothetical protein WCO06_01340 [Candidatus Roizmanbacteria bacterium]
MDVDLQKQLSEIKEISKAASELSYRVGVDVSIIKKKMDDNYSKRELDDHFLEIKNSLNRIETQTVKTNGRVTACEKDAIATEGKVNTITKIGVALWVVSVPLVMYIYSREVGNLEKHQEEILKNEIQLSNTIIK